MVPLIFISKIDNLGNLEKYGEETAPLYNLENIINFPIAIFAGQ